LTVKIRRNLLTLIILAIKTKKICFLKKMGYIFNNKAIKSPFKIEGADLQKIYLNIIN